ncbi:hypothetical protein OS493_007840 [Desmophyllum pertusum]|uniref:Sulfotransferase domain-containing protein n=1 Tax=Desmophyllum pertusum TaxID=174260 RepID=A0A9X0CP38_9CNID|nr:hypothetical protein OS493_007840 [Desmophyllum pertusum]
MKLMARNLWRHTWRIRLPVVFKKSFLICLMVLIFLSLTFTYISKNPIRTGRHYAYNDTTIAMEISSESQLQFTPKKNIESIKHSKRANIVIMSYPRSGSSFLGDVFNHHPEVFYLFEPLRTVQRSFSKDSVFEFDFSSTSYQNSASTFLKDIMNCTFSSNDTFIRYLIPQDRNNSLALISPPFCAKNGTSMVCQNLKSQELETVCRENYNVFAAKIISPRLPTVHEKWNEAFFRSCSTNGTSKCNIIHLVRDPRAVVCSLKSVGFFKRRNDPSRELSWFVKKICHQMELDLKVGMLTRYSLPDGYRLIRFEDLARSPLSAASELYEFAGIEMLDSVKKWLHETTKSQNGRGSAYSTTRDSKQVVSSWRTKLSSADVQIVENYCGKVMTQLNYKLTVFG